MVKSRARSCAPADSLTGDVLSMRSAALLDPLVGAAGVQVQAVGGEELAAQLEADRVVFLVDVDVGRVAGVPDSGAGVVVRLAGRPGPQLGQLDERRDAVEVRGGVEAVAAGCRLAAPAQLGREDALRQEVAVADVAHHHRVGRGRHRGPDVALEEGRRAEGGAGGGVDGVAGQEAPDERAARRQGVALGEVGVVDVDEQRVAVEAEREDGAQAVGQDRLVLQEDRRVVLLRLAAQPVPPRGLVAVAGADVDALDDAEVDLAERLELHVDDVGDRVGGQADPAERLDPLVGVQVGVVPERAHGEPVRQRHVGAQVALVAVDVEVAQGADGHELVLAACNAAATPTPRCRARRGGRGGRRSARPGQSRPGAAPSARTRGAAGRFPRDTSAACARLTRRRGKRSIRPGR